MQYKKYKCFVTLWMLSIFFIGIILIDITSYAATSGKIPCTEGSVTWTLSDEGDLVLSGDGRVGVENQYYENWKDTWRMSGLSYIRGEVRTFSVQEGSHIELNTYCQMFSGFVNCISIDMTGLHANDLSHPCAQMMFLNCSNLMEIYWGDLDFSKVLYMGDMFRGCTRLKEINLNGLDLSSLTSAQDMFQDCNSLEKIDLSVFNSVNLTNIDNMFEGCNSLSELDLSSFKAVKNCTLGNCSNLKKIVSGQGTNTYTIYTDGGLWHDDDKNVYDESGDIVLESCTTIYKVKDFYNINYVSQGDLIECPKTYTYAHGADSLGYAELPYHTFVGWYLEEDFITPVPFISAKQIGDIILYGKLIPNIYNIQYYGVEDVINLDDLPTQYAYGTKSKIPVLMRNCHIFKGWYLDATYTKSFDRIIATTNGDLSLYAKWEDAHNYDMGNGKVIKEATTTTAGIIEYTCKNCTNTTTSVIPKLTVDNVSDETLAVTDESIRDTRNDNDIEGSSFVMIQARADKVTKKSICLKWNKVKDADGYKIYGNKCGKKNRYEHIKTISNGNATKYTQKRLKKGTYYKYIVRAYKLIDGREVTIAASKTIHASTTGGKYGNAKSVKLKTDSKMKVKNGVYILTIKKNKKYTIKALEVKKNKKIKIHRRIAFESNDTNVATVSNKGVVRGIKKGTCCIYAYAQDGVYKKIKVQVQ